MDGWAFMKIKDHSSIVLWPPVWTTGADESPPSGKEEELILRKVELLDRSRLDSSRGYIRLSAELWQEIETRTSMFTGKTITSKKMGNKIYTGLVTILRDPEFLDQLYQKLQNLIGQTIREIGDSEIEVT
jgi:hypothetical protein